MSDSQRPAPDARPRFARGYPDDARLDRLVALMSAGNHRAARAEAEALITSAPEPEVRAAAQDLRGRLAPDPIAFVLLGATALLLLTLTMWAIGRSHQNETGPLGPRAPASARPPMTR